MEYDEFQSTNELGVDKYQDVERLLLIRNSIRRYVDVVGVLRFTQVRDRLHDGFRLTKKVLDDSLTTDKPIWRKNAARYNVTFDQVAKLQTSDSPEHDMALLLTELAEWEARIINKDLGYLLGDDIQLSADTEDEMIREFSTEDVHVPGIRLDLDLEHLADIASESNQTAKNDFDMTVIDVLQMRTLNPQAFLERSDSFFKKTSNPHIPYRDELRSLPEYNK